MLNSIGDSATKDRGHSTVVAFSDENDMAHVMKRYLQSKLSYSNIATSDPAQDPHGSNSVITVQYGPWASHEISIFYQPEIGADIHGRRPNGQWRPVSNDHRGLLSQYPTKI